MIFDKRKSYKPFAYPEFYDLWLKHERMHWISREVPLHGDIKDFNNKLTDKDRKFLANVFRLFVSADVDVAEGYVKNYLPYFEHPEIRMMLLGFAAREAVHIDAYSYLIETLGYPDDFYAEFLNIPIMRDKHEYFEKIVNEDASLPIKIAGISAFTEGMFLFSSFVLLLTYPKNGRMKGMGQIVSWSVLDENCLTEDAEVFTKSGWKKISEVSLNDDIIQYNPEDGLCNFTRPENLIKNTTDRTITFSGKSFYQKVTPEHRMIIETEDGTRKDVLAKNLVGMENFKYILSGSKVGELKKMSEKHKELCILSAKKELSLEWVVPLMDIMDSSWANEFLQLYSENS